MKSLPLTFPLLATLFAMPAAFVACGGDTDSGTGSGGKNAGGDDSVSGQSAGGTGGGSSPSGGAEAGGGEAAAAGGGNPAAGAAGSTARGGAASVECPADSPAKTPSVCSTAQQGKLCKYADSCFFCGCMPQQAGMYCAYGSGECPK